MDPMIASRSDARLPQLDALRGLAALFVVFNHLTLAVPDEIRLAIQGDMLWSPEAWLNPWPWLRFTPFRLLVSNGAPVDLFFVLSGFVLALPVTPAAQPAFWSFLIKRVCRIYIPFATSILLVVCAYALIPTAPSAGASAWFNGKLHTPDLIEIVRHLAMIGAEGDARLNPVMWTLVHEMRVSLIMPLLFLAVRRFGAIPILIICTLVSIWVSMTGARFDTGNWQTTLHVLWMFSAGIALAYNRARISPHIARYGRTLFCSLVILALGLLSVPFSRIWGDFMIGIGATLLIALCLPNHRLSRGLQVPPLLWLGRISYSLYLVHFPILLFLIASGVASGPSLLLLVPILLGAELLYRAVEAPAQRLGGMLARQFQPAWVGPPESVGRVSGSGR